jgi:uncharacterized membrane protein
MFSFAILAGFAVAAFFLVVVPWLAISGRRDARIAKAGMESIRDQVVALSRELDGARAQLRNLVERGEPAPAAPLPPPERARKTRAAARTASDEAKAERVAGLEPTQPAPPEPQTPAGGEAFVSPWAGVASQPAGSVSSPAPQLPAERARDFEEVIGTRWAIWVGGAALALGSLFLVKYTIEAGFFGPAARLTIATLFSLALIAAGELLRRGAVLPRALAGQLPAEHAPLALTAAGTVGLFGAVYAAYALYGYVGQTGAFVLLGLIGVAAMAASAVHGQALAGLGLVASYATPILVGGESRNRWPLVVFLLVVTAAGLAVQSRIRTLWMGWALVAGVAVWTGLLVVAQIPPAAAELAFILASLALFAGAFLVLARPRHPLTPLGDPLPAAALSGLVAAIGLSFVVQNGGLGLHAGAALLAIALVCAAAVLDGRTGVAVIAAGLLPLGMILTWPSLSGAAPMHARVVAGALFVVTEAPRGAGMLASFAAAAAAVLMLAPLLFFMRRLQARVPPARGGAMALAVVGGLSAPALAFAWAVRTSGLAQNLSAAAAIAAVCLALAFVTHRLISRANPSESLSSSETGIGAGGYGAGASLALGFAIALALPGLWMAVGFAVAAAAVAFLNSRQPLPMLRRVTMAFATTALLRAALTPVWQPDGAWPVLNSYVVAYGLPALLLAAAARLLAREAQDRAVKAVLLNAGLMAAGYVAYTIRHAFHGADLVDRVRFGLGESGLYALACLLAALGLFAARGRVGAGQMASLRSVIGAVNGVGLGLLVALVLIAANPWLEGRISGPPVVDSTFVGFVLPALALGVLAYFGRTMPDWFVGRLTAANRIVAIGLGYLYLVAQTRLMFVGQERFRRAYTGELEQYAYSAVTLAFGVLLLAIGFRLGSRPTRVASAIFVTLAVLKVFLFDMSELEGLLRAISFIGLGAVLIGIGLAYQRLLFDRRTMQGEVLLASDEASGQHVVP